MVEQPANEAGAFSDGECLQRGNVHNNARVPVALFARPHGSTTLLSCTLRNALKGECSHYCIRPQASSASNAGCHHPHLPSSLLSSTNQPNMCHVGGKLRGAVLSYPWRCWSYSTKVHTSHPSGARQTSSMARRRASARSTQTLVRAGLSMFTCACSHQCRTEQNPKLCTVQPTKQIRIWIHLMYTPILV